MPIDILFLNSSGCTTHKTFKFLKKIFEYTNITAYELLTMKGFTRVFRYPSNIPFLCLGQVNFPPRGTAKREQGKRFKRSVALRRPVPSQFPEHRGS